MEIWKLKLILIFFLSTVLQCFSISSDNTLLPPTNNGINMTNLLRHYINVCGFGYLCDDTIDDHSKYVTKARFPNCPPCYCDDMCYFNGNCCPDKYFYEYQSNQNTRVYSSLRSVLFFKPYHKEQQMTMKLIDKCPPVTSLSQRKKCEKARTPLERVFAPPSTSLTSKLVYWNKFCALCHGEREIKLHFWKIAFTKSCNISIFYVPSWEEVLEIVKSDFKTCLMGHIPPSMDGQELPLDNLVTKCSLNFNDTDIMKGCSSMYNLKYRNYKNIFCAMCVPFEENDDSSVISSCNPQSSSYLGMSKSEFYILEKRCNNSGIYPLTYPYQNVFCYLCNMRVSQRPRGNANIVYYADIKADVGEVLSFEKINAYNIYFQKIKLGDFEWTEDYIRDVVMKVDFNIFKDHDAATALNMTRLAKLFVATTTDCPGLDTDSGLNNDLQVIRPCENNTRCLFGRADYCCLEMFVKTPVSCIPSGSEDKSYLVINDCIVEKFNPRDRRDRSKDFARKHLCRKEINFPIEFDGKSYKNIFCFLCTEGKWNIQTANLWSFALKCPKEIPLLYYVDGVPNIMKEARSRRCDVIFDTSSAYECLTGITKCSYHGEQDVVTACQDTALQYYGRGRELCETCRHPPVSALRKSNCRLGSVHYTKELQRKCEEFPQVNSYKLGIYKNRFCFECNGLTESPKHCEPPKRGSTYSEFATLENVMQSVLSGSPKRLKSDEVGPICYPGRVWSGRRCEALLNHMTKGIYVLQMMLDILVERPTDDDLYEQLKEITSEINAHLSVVLGIDNLVLNLFPVGVQKKPNDDYIVKTILRIIHPGGDYNRDEYERKLLSIGNSLEEFTSDNSQTMKEFTIIKITETLSFSLNDVSIEFLPDIVKYLRGVKDFYEQISPPVNFVSELLFCEHKVIRESYLYDDKSMSIKLQSGLSIPVGLFIRWNGNIQVCKSSDFDNMLINNSSQNDFSNVSVILRYMSLGIFTCSFLALSIIILTRKSQSFSLPYLSRLTFFLIAELVVCILSEELVPSETVCCVYGVLRHYSTLLVGLSIYFYGRSIISENESLKENKISDEFYYKVLIIVPIIIILFNSVIMKVTQKSFGYCRNVEICYLYFVPFLLLSVYLPLSIITIGLGIQFIQTLMSGSKVGFKLDKVLSVLCCLLVILMAAGWIFQALFILKYINVLLLGYVAILSQSMMTLVCTCYYIYKTSNELDKSKRESKQT